MTVFKTLLLSAAFASSVIEAQQTQQTQPQQAPTERAANQAPASACSTESDPDAKITCLQKERERLLKLERIKQIERDNNAIGKVPTEAPAPKQKKSFDCLMAGQKQKKMPEWMRGWYEANRARIISSTKGQITPPPFDVANQPLPPCPFEPAIPVTTK